jgi:2-methylcitrate dehydratase PrpD
MLNGTICRALDFCDAMAPGPHIGSSLLPAALAAAELRGGCSGAELMAALVVGAEVGARMNLTEAMYDGFDPTGVAVVFAATAAAARVLGLDAAGAHQALALAFNRCAGSFQSNVDGSLAVRLIQGWTTEAGVACAQLAQRGLTGPSNFLEGHYGYAHLFGRDRLAPADVIDGLGARWALERTMFKKFPSCGVTQGLTDLALRLARDHGLAPADVAGARVTLPPYAWRLVGHGLRIGANPRVDAQFSARWCVANALVRGASRLAHFRPDAVRDEAVLALAARIDAVADAALDARGHSAVDLRIHTRDGRVLSAGHDVAPGYPDHPLSDAEHEARFSDCLDYAPRALPRAAELPGAIERIEALADARELVAMLVA